MKTRLIFAACLMMATAGCVQIEKGATLKPLPAVAKDDVRVFVSSQDIGSSYQVIDTMRIDFEEYERDQMIDRLRKMAGDRGANAILLDKDFPRPDGWRALPPVIFNHSDRYTGAAAIHIGPPLPKDYIIEGLGAP